MGISHEKYMYTMAVQIDISIRYMYNQNPYHFNKDTANGGQ